MFRYSWEKEAKTSDFLKQIIHCMTSDNIIPVTPPGYQLELTRKGTAVIQHLFIIKAKQMVISHILGGA